MSETVGGEYFDLSSVSVQEISMATRMHNRHRAECKRRLVRAYQNGERSCKHLAVGHGISHSLLVLWVQKYQRRESNDEHYESERIREYESKIATLERKVGQLTMEHDLHKETPLTLVSSRGASSLTIAGPPAAASSEDAKS